MLVGFDIELVQRFAASLGRTARFSQMPFGSLIAAKATGKVDMIAASIFITEERKQRIDFSDPYQLVGRPGLRPEVDHRRRRPVRIRRAAHACPSVDDLKDKRIGVQLGTV